MPHSSYGYRIDDEYREKLNNLFWSVIPIVENTKYSPIIDTATFDVDGDGVISYAETVHFAVRFLAEQALDEE